ncbi:MAG: hypothetical protein AAF598_15180 [Bacteroidota bacterium]
MNNRSLKPLLFLLCWMLLGIQTTQAQIPPGMEDLYLQQQSQKLPKAYKVLPSPSVIGAGIPSLPGETPTPLRKAFESGDACILVLQQEYYDYCPGDDDETAELTAWVMRLDPDNAFNSFSVHPGTNKATLRLQGPMDKYVPGATYCENTELVRAETGLGTFVADFTTTMHTSPRTFQVIEQGPPDSQTMQDLKELRDFWRKNVLAYLERVKNHQYEPHIRIGGNGRVPPPPPQRPPIKHGTQDKGDAGQDNGWSSTRDGFGYAKTAIDALTTATDYVDLASKGAKLYGAVTKFKKGVAKAALDFIGSAASAAGFDANYMSEQQMLATTDMMIAAMGEINKQYADNSNQAAQEAWEKSKMPVKDPRFYQEGMDAGFLLYQLNDLFNQLDEIEEELAELEFPKSAVRGSIQGPGLYQNLASLKQEGAPVTMVATSTAVQESMAAASPDNLQQLKDMGFDIPDEILKMDLEAMMNDAQKEIDGKVDLDIQAPLFNGIISTTNTVTLDKGRTKFQNYQIFFAISSPNEPDEESWWYAESIFDDPLREDEDPKPKAITYYIATDGSDANPGTANLPFATLQKALDAALEFQRTRMPVEIVVKDGTYRQSASMDWNGIPNIAPLTIRAENRHGAIFKGSEPVDEAIEWRQNLNKQTGGWLANLPLHPEQWSYTPGSNPLTDPAPVLVVNDQTLMHLPMLPPQASGLYSLRADEVQVGPPVEVTDLNEATVEVSTRRYAIELKGGGSVEVSGLRLLHYPYPYPNNSPGVLHNGNVSVVGCRFQ